jgi:type IV pilus assembly protein PilC
MDAIAGRRFVYRARDGAGKLIRGEITAGDKLAACRVLRDERQLYVVACDPADTGNVAATMSTRIVYWWHGLTLTKAKLLFYRQMAMFLAHALPTERALEHCYESAVNPRFRHTLRVILANVVGGTYAKLSDAAEQHPDDFSALEIAMFRAGEGGAGFPSILARLAKIFERRQRILSKLTLSAIYPAVIVLLTGAFIVFTVTVFVPKFTSFAASYGESQPAPLHVLVVIAGALLDPLITTATLVGFIATVVLIRRAARNEGIARYLDTIACRLPVVGPIRRLVMMASFSRLFSALYAAGVPLSEVYDLSSRAVGSPLYGDGIMAAGRHVTTGKGTQAAGLRASGLFDREYLALVSAGEESSSLVETHELICEQYEGYADEQTDTAIKLLEPAMIGFASSAVFAVVIAVYTSIYGIIPHMR